MDVAIMLGITQIFYLGIGLIMMGGGAWDLLKQRGSSHDIDMAVLTRWSSLALIIFGILILISGLTQVFGTTAGA